MATCRRAGGRPRLSAGWPVRSDRVGERARAGRRLRLDELKVSLDQFWDLLRQRRALREAGRDPDAASVRPRDVVERYQQ
jgi:Protein of unknown function (DUF2630)